MIVGPNAQFQSIGCDLCVINPVDCVNQKDQPGSIREGNGNNEREAGETLRHGVRLAGLVGLAQQVDRQVGLKAESEPEKMYVNLSRP